MLVDLNYLPELSSRSVDGVATVCFFSVLGPRPCRAILRHMFYRIPGVEVFNWEVRRTQTRWFEMRFLEGCEFAACG